MLLTSGTRLGPYEIIGAVGAGGMGEVYRARDTKLGREVAIKVLPAAFAGDAARIARLQPAAGRAADPHPPRPRPGAAARRPRSRRGARRLAVLTHPGIATIHGFEEADSRRALVMELVPGPTLAERIALGPLPSHQAPHNGPP